MRSSEIRKTFLEYFEKNGHKIVASSSLVPAGDPTLLFVNAGMVQFKNVFLGDETRSYKRATSSQKCMRVSGKHNDLDNVGRTPRHHTFFEMLGNFSFGDYFKKDAIDFAWKFLTEELKLPKEKLWITIFETDDEAEKLWLRHVKKNRIFRCGEKDNFWSMGDTGPCGPCSEIHWDFGSGQITKEDLESDRIFEIWNLVFMEQERFANGDLKPLAKPSIDTGMGFERITAVLQNKKNNWETDLFMPLIEEIRNLGKYSQSEETIIAERVAADHARAAAFLVADGIIPSNEGRGYVLRRLLRRASRYGRELNFHEPFLYKIAAHVTEMMGDAYPELISHKSSIEKAVLTEEKRFLETLDKGMTILEDEFKKLASKDEKVLPGEVAFKLYDTFGFPHDLTALIAEERNLKIDDEGFASLMEKQKHLARSSRKQEKQAEVWNEIAGRKLQTNFVGYDRTKEKGNILTIIKDGKIVKSAKAGDQVDIITEKTPFYGEKGGQIGDVGIFKNTNVKIEIENTWWPIDGVISHRGTIKSGKLSVGDEVELIVDEERRNSIRNHHTATHLLHSALRNVLGGHVRQMGSLVESDRLRFDFSHFSGLTKDETKKVENEVNEMIKANNSVSTNVMDYEEAVSSGALAFFEDKYTDQVRVVNAGNLSTELCGGTHAEKTGDIKLFKIISESSVAAGVRRIEAVVGDVAFRYLEWFKEEYNDICEMLKIAPEKLGGKIENMILAAKGRAFKDFDIDKKYKEKIEKNNWNLAEYEEEFFKISKSLKVAPKEVRMRIKKLLTEIEAKKEQGKKSAPKIDVEDVIKNSKNVGNTKIITIRADGANPKELRNIADEIKSKVTNGVALIASSENEKVQVIVISTNEKYNAGKIMQRIAPIVDGKGGGRPDMAQGGGTNVNKVDELIFEFENTIK